MKDAKKVIRNALFGIVSGAFAGVFIGTEQLFAFGLLFFPGTFFAIGYFRADPRPRGKYDLVKLMLVSNIAYWIAFFTPGKPFPVLSVPYFAATGCLGGIFLLLGMVFVLKYDSVKHGWLFVSLSGLLLAILFGESIWEGSSFEHLRLPVAFACWQGGVSAVLGVVLRKEVKAEVP
jgi:hypothetical protein